MDPSNQFPGSFKRRIIIDDDSDSNDDDDTASSTEFQLQSKAKTTTTAATATQKNNGSVAPSATSFGANKTAPSAGQRRKHSIGSILSDSSGELEELFRKTCISKKLLSKPPAEINIKCYNSSSDDESFESEKKKRIPIAKQSIATKSDKDDQNDEDDSDDSAWCQKEGSDDFCLSQKKRPDVDWPDLHLPGPLYKQLYSFQRVGVQWMATLHANGIGGILGDDMGMGKTYVTLSYLGGLMRAGTIRNALVIAPLSVLRSWENTGRKILRQCVSSFKVTVVNSDMSRKRRLEFIDSLTKKTKSGRTPVCNLVITTYGLVRSATADFTSGNKTIWHYVALDEGHTIKNSAAEASKACRAICSPDTRRLLLTGTPILNNLKELWSLFDFATSGEVLGTSRSFTQYYAIHIEAARDRLATQGIIELGQRKNKELQERIKPYFLQRLKIDFLADKLPPKHDVVVWTHLSEDQRQRYTEFVESKDSIVRDILTGRVQSPLEGVTWLKKLCGHPLLIEAAGEKMTDVLRHRRPKDILRQSAKLQVLVDLVQHLKRQGHRMLIFSQSTKMLDTIHFVLRDRFVLGRIDGSTKEQDRQYFVDSFNQQGSRYDAMLLSTKAAGCGLTLTGADTSIIYDPSWTPAEDAQAVDRCYRIGQKKEVTVYRLIAAGTVEEKTYEKQVHKDGIRRAVLTQDENVTRYFERHELRDLFQLGEPGVCRVFDRFKHMVDIDRYEFVYDLDGVIGITPHDGFYSLKDGENNANKGKGAFDGPLKQAPPKILGKAQRVMARAAQHDVTTIEQEIGKLSLNDEASPAKRKSATTKKALGSAWQNKSGFSLDDDANPAKPKSAATKKSLGSDWQNENTPNGAESNTSSEELSDSSSQAVVTMLNKAAELVEKGHKRKSLEILIDLVESGTPEGEQKLEVHKRLASIGHDLDLLY